MSIENVDYIFDNESACEFLTLLSHRLIGLENHFNELDSIIGDSDHGSTLSRGFRSGLAVLELLQGDQGDDSSCAGIDEVFREFAKALIGSMGGAIGPIYGMFFLQFARELKGAQSEVLTPEVFSASLGSALDKIKDLGEADVGDKTIVDALAPAYEAAQEVVDASERRGLLLYDSVRLAYDGAERGRAATIPLRAKRGRSKYAKERSIGHVDPGASSLVCVFQAWEEFLKSKRSLS